MSKAYHTTRDLVIPAGTKLIHLNGRLVFGAFEPVPHCQFGLSVGLDTALELGVIEEGER